VASYWDEAKVCYQATLTALAGTQTIIAEVFSQSEADNERVILMLVERKISWGDADRQQKENDQTALARLRALRI